MGQEVIADKIIDMLIGEGMTIDGAAAFLRELAGKIIAPVHAEMDAMVAKPLTKEA